MTEKLHLKQICDYEQAIYEKNATIEKSKKEIERVKGEVAVKKEKFNKLLNANKTKLKDTKLKRDRCLNYKPNGVLFPVFIMAIVIAATIVFHLLLKFFIVDVVEATSVSDALFSVILMNLIPTFLIGLIIKLGTLAQTTTLVICSIVIDAILTIIGANYLQISLDNGKNFSSAILVAMLFFIVLEVIICLIACYFTNNSQQKMLVSNKKRAKTLEKECKEINDYITKINQSILQYTQKTDKAIGLMQQDYNKQEKDLKQLKETLTKLYAQNIVHPKYQNWVAVATLYEYLDIGRCYELKGPHGAYNLYEQELVAKKIVDSLGAISSSTSSISSSQFYIRNQLSTINEKLDRMIIDTYGV